MLNDKYQFKLVKTVNGKYQILRKRLYKPWWLFWQKHYTPEWGTYKYSETYEDSAGDTQVVSGIFFELEDALNLLASFDVWPKDEVSKKEIKNHLLKR